MTIAIKYCGGCNPRFDRVAAAAQLAAAFPHLSMVPARSGAPADLLVVLCGCPSRCADVTHLQASETLWVCRSEDLQAVYDRLQRIQTERSEP